MSILWSRWRATRIAVVAGPCLALFIAFSCSESSDAPANLAAPADVARDADTSRSSADVLERARSTFGDVLAASASTLRDRISGRGEELVVEGRAAIDGTVVLPRFATGATELAHPPSGVAVEIALQGASAARGEIADGIAVYPGAAPGGGDVIARPTATGVEDYAVYWTRPAHDELRWTLRTTGVRALRQVAGRVELLDAMGAPRIRVEPPYVIDAARRRHAADVSIEGCPVDVDPRAPWRRPVVELGGVDACDLVVRFSPAIEAPLLVDPEWRFAANMSVERTHHTATLLASGDIFVAGGFDAAENAVALTELFCPDDVCAPTGAFSPGSNLLVARGSHTATRVTPTGKVLLTGGAAAYTTSGGLASAELYDPTAAPPNDHVLLPPMSVARVGHTATLLSTGNQVLVAGGDGANPSSAQVFDVATLGFGGAISMQESRRFHVAEVAGTNRVLVAGGDTGGPVASSTAEYFDEGDQQFHALADTMTTNRAFATATRIATTGDILIAGGTNLQGFYSPTADLFRIATLDFEPQAYVMQVGRASHTATVLVAENRILLSGGFNATGVLAETEVFPFGQSQSEISATMGEPHNFHAAVLMASGRPVVIGGGKDGTPTDPGSGATLVASAIRAEILFRANGEPCVDDEECSSKHCYDLDGGPGICCDETCSDPCRSCRADDTADPGDTDGFCAVVGDGHPVSEQCANEVEFALVCVGGTISIDGGQVTPCGGYACDDLGASCLQSCANDGDCDEDHFCAAPTCFEKKLQGETCNASNECQTGKCVDGFCCNADCGGQCEACDVENSEGVCVQVPSGAPHGQRPTCAGGGTECEGTCGTNPTKCDYPVVPCGASTCSNGVENGGTCDGNGTCAPATQACGAYACDLAGTRCLEQCVDTAQCAEGAICRSDETCAAVTGAECDDHVVVEPNGTTVDCSPFRCDEGGCMDRCTSVDDCIEGKVCDEAGACVDPPPDPAPPEDCSFRPASRDSGVGSLGLLLFAAALSRASRRATKRGAAR